MSCLGLLPCTWPLPLSKLGLVTGDRTGSGGRWLEVNIKSKRPELQDGCSWENVLAGGNVMASARGQGYSGRGLVGEVWRWVQRLWGSKVV